MEESNGASSEDVNDVKVTLLSDTSPSASPIPPSHSLSKPIENSTWFGGIRYDNPWDTWLDFWHKIGPMFRWKFCNLPRWSPPEDEADRCLPVREKEEILDELANLPASNQVRATWLGHASVLMQFKTANVLCDPVFAYRIGPIKIPGISYNRYRRAPLEVEDLPPIDAVVISHNHYDHLDYDSVKLLYERFEDKIKWLVPKGLKQWICDVGISEKDVIELCWWENYTLEEKDLVFTFTPAQHWCLRTGFDKNRVLWGSWAICSKTVKTWFGGDTGYCKTFKEIGEQFGYFDFAAVPIGAFLPRDVMRDQHVEPKESVLIHQDLNCKKSLGVHWGTFTMGAIEHFMAPKEEMEKERDAAGIFPEDFFVLDHGGSFMVTAAQSSD